MGSDLLTCGTWLLALVGLFVAFVVWSVISTKQESRRRHEEVLAWAERERQEREEDEKLSTIAAVWEDVAAYFSFLPPPSSESDNPDDAIRACVRRLMSVPSLGTFTHAKLPAPALPTAERRRHLYVVGKTGSGKTTFLEHLIRQDLEAGHGVGVMAPEGELFRARLLPLVPDSRRPRDVIYFAPGDLKCPVTFNPLSLAEGDDALRAAEDLFTIFRRALGGDDLGPRMQPILQNAFALLVGRPGATLWDVKQLLTDARFRERVIAETPDPYIREFWQETFPRFAKGADLPLLSRLDHFLRPPVVRRALCHPVSTMSIREVLQEGKVLFVDLFGLSEDTRAVVGQMLLSKFQIELMRRELAGGAAAPFFLYCDEFQSFAGFAEGVWRELLSRGRKYGLALTLAHQFPAQLPNALQEEIFGNVNSIMAFALGNKDAQVVRKELLAMVPRGKEERLEPLPAEALLELRVGEAYAKLAGGRAVRIFMPPPLRVKDLKAGEDVMRESWAWHAAPIVLPESSIAEPQDAPEAEPTAPEVEPQTAPKAEEPQAKAPPEPPPRRKKDKPAAPPSLGRGGPEHTYLQELVKQWGEAKGLRATIELPVLDGAGSVDVVLEREGWRLACEISVTSTVEQEVGNVEKCLAAGFDEVVVISPKARRLASLRKALEKRLGEEALARVSLLSPEEFALYLDTLPAREEVGTVGGYQVKVSYQARPPGERQARARAVAGVIARSLSRLKGTKG